MEDVDFKQMILVFLLCMAIMMGWMVMTGKFKPPAEQPVQAPDSSAPVSSTQAPATTSGTNGGAAAPAGAAGAQIGSASGRWHVEMVSTAGQDVTIGDRQNIPGGFKAQVTFDGTTGAVSTALLSEHKRLVTDKEYGYPLLNPVVDQNDKKYDSLMLGEMRLTGHNEQIDLSRNCWALVQKESLADGTAMCRYRAVVLDGQDKKVLEIYKTYRLSLNQYDLDFKLTFKNLTQQPIQVDSLELVGPVGILREDPRSDRLREFLAAYTVKDQQIDVERQNLMSIESKPEKALLDVPGNVQSLSWYGFANKYFASVVHPVPQANENRVDYLKHNQVKAVAFSRQNNISSSEKAKPLAIESTLSMPQPLPGGGESSYAFQMFMGPIDRNLFNNPEYPQYAQRHYEKLVHVSWCAFEWLTFLLLTIMGGVYKIVGNYGIAIMILVLLVRLVLHPITKRSQVSMMKMGKLGPQLEEIKKKYANNPQEIQKRTMAVYKEQGFSPMLGCLPMFLQMPIWVALYTAVNANVALRHKGLFSAYWLTDLSSPDRLVPFSVFGMHHPINIPLVGGVDAINLLPILLCVAMFLQTKYSPQSKMTSANPQAAQQQKMMLYLMPVMMLVFFYSAPSGLNLYIMSSTFCGLIEQHFIRKHIREKEAEDALVTVSGTKKIKTALGPKKKKPKPPVKYM